MVGRDRELEGMLEASIAAAAAANPDRDTNPAQSLEEFYDFVEWSATTLPNFILKLPTGASLYDRLDQGVDYFYFLIDQPLEALWDKGYYRPCLQYHEPFRSWVARYCRDWGAFLSTPASWKPSYAEDFYADPDFGVPRDWYEDPARWHSFNDFFSRRLRDASARPVAAPDDDTVVVSPVDGYPQGVWRIGADNHLIQRDGVLLKSRRFDSAADLLGPESLYREAFAGGTLTHVFLDVNDYHRYHFPLGGVIREMHRIPGCDAGGGTYRWDAAAQRYVLECATPGWESVETRACLVLETAWGPVALLPIGMSQICSVNFRPGLAPGVTVRKGEEMGHFLFGGSDFVLLFGKNVNFVPAGAAPGGHILTGERLGTLDGIR